MDRWSKAALWGVVHSGQRRSRGTWKRGANGSPGKWCPETQPNWILTLPTLASGLQPGYSLSSFPPTDDLHSLPDCALAHPLEKSSLLPWSSCSFHSLQTDTPVSLWSFTSSLVVSTTSPSEKCCTYKNLFLPYIKNRIYLFKIKIMPNQKE